MNNVDIRPAVFLSALEEIGNWTAACEQSNMTVDEVEQLCQSDEVFDLAQVEALLSSIEKQMNEATYVAIELARQTCKDNLEKLRQDALQKFRARHPRV